MKWIELHHTQQLNEIIEKSKSEPIIIFKHSTRCPISSMALNRFEAKWNFSIDSYFLDLIQFRNVSNEIETIFSVHHQSPQILLIKNGVCIYHSSHISISASDIYNQLNEHK